MRGMWKVYCDKRWLNVFLQTLDVCLSLSCAQTSALFSSVWKLRDSNSGLDKRWLNVFLQTLDVCFALSCAQTSIILSGVWKLRDLNFGVCYK
jgi:hypothetical protein